MYYFVIHAVLDPNQEHHPDAEGAGGAFVSCWIDFKDHEGAEVLARHYIARVGWIPKDLDPELTRCPERSDYSDGEPGLQYFDEAAETGSCFSFALYPPSDEDSTA